MSGYLTVANEAIAIARSEPMYTAAILRLYMDADIRNWGPFDCSDRWLMQTFDLPKREARDLVRRLVQSECMFIEFEGNENRPRSVRLACPQANQTRREKTPKRLDRGANRVPDRVPDREDIDQEPIVDESEPRTEPRVGPRAEPKEDTSSTSTSDTSTLDTLGTAIAAALDDPMIGVEVVLKSTPGPSRLVTAAWDAEYQRAFGVKYPWAFEGRDHDGSKLKRWMKQAKVDPADPLPGVDRLRRAFRAYFEGVEAGAAFPPGKATTKGFDYGIANWLLSEPNGARDGPSRTMDEAKQRWGFRGGT